MHALNYNTYQKNQIITASPEQILLMLYDGAIRFTRQAVLGVAQGDREMVRHGCGKALAIITEFSNTLNHEIGGEIAENLDALYGFMIRELTMANLHQDKEKLAVVEKLLVDLRTTWGEAVEINRQNPLVAKAAETGNKATVVEMGARVGAPPANYVPFAVAR